MQPESTMLSAPDTSFGEVYDRGYHHYDGQRLGRKQAFRALTIYSMKRALGSKKSWTAKVTPTLMYIAAGLMVAIPLGIRAFIDDAGVVEYWEYFGAIYVILTVFLASVAPEMLCNDRHENVLPLYFARAISRADYILAKVLATTLLTMTITLLPTAIYWLGRQLLEDSPLSAMKDNLDDLARVVVMCVVTSLFLASISLVISSLTGRKSIAAAGIIVVLLVISFISYGVAESGISADAAAYVLLANPLGLVEYFTYSLFDQVVESTNEVTRFATGVYGGVMMLVVLVCCGVMFWRYVPSD
ncbi:MAG: ABC transporter permease [Thermomicrobiales bacterium]